MWWNIETILPPLIRTVYQHESATLQENVTWLNLIRYIHTCIWQWRVITTQHLVRYKGNDQTNLNIWNTDHIWQQAERWSAIQGIWVRDNSTLTVLTKIEDRRVWSTTATGDLSKAAISWAWLRSGWENGKMADGWREAKWIDASKSPTLLPAMSRLADYFVIVGYDHEKESK